MEKDNINYEYIAKAQELYNQKGYQNIKTPWVVSDDAVNVTMPKYCRPFKTFKGSLVGSGEQGFIELMLQNKLQCGKYQTTTPCFRDEYAYNNLTLLSFFKIELINILSKEEGKYIADCYERKKLYKCNDYEYKYVYEILGDALNVFTSFFADNSILLNIRHDEVGLDIYMGDIEIGSYGFRYYNENYWIYGTGLAEPRFSIAYNMLK